VKSIFSVPAVAKFRVDLKYPNVAVDQFGNVGTWTMVYNQVGWTFNNLFMMCTPLLLKGI
jgi:hypothetical protein